MHIYVCICVLKMAYTQYKNMTFTLRSTFCSVIDVDQRLVKYYYIMIKACGGILIQIFVSNLLVSIAYE